MPVAALFHRPSLPKPRGLWRRRANNSPRFHHPDRKLESPASVSDSSDHDSDSDDSDLRSDISDISKRRRLSVSDSDADVEFWDYARQCSPAPESSSRHREKIMDSTTTAQPGSQTRIAASCDLEDWEDLKELFARAAETYESDESEALPLLRGVIHECHRFLNFYHDPSVLFVPPPRSHNASPEILAPMSERHGHDWAKGVRIIVPRKNSPPNDSKPLELPTAFHAILGTSLFLFGNFIAQDPSLALEGEPTGPVPYWLAALDVFETGENLPSKTGGYTYDYPEDWRMAIVWGRTLVCLADEIISNSRDNITPPHPTDDPKWPANSPFSAIASRRPPMTRRVSLSSDSPNDLMLLAMDQFSRGIFHMPHPQHAHSSSPRCGPAFAETFSRAKELFTIASEVLGVADRLENAAERKYWASWADSVFNQMKMESDMDAWRGRITLARGRCWLIVGLARVDEFEAAMERGEMDILLSDDVREAREGLQTAISFFERTKGSATAAFVPDEREVQPLLTEALLTLANLTPDESEREAIYARAQAEGGDDLHLSDHMDDDE